MNNIIKFILSVLLPVIIGAISGFATNDAINGWYTTLDKPFFNPPNWLFWPVWSILYILIWIAFYLVWKNNFWKNSFQTKIIYFSQLFFNFTWSFSFFYFESPLLGLINIFILWILIAVNIKYFYKINKVSGIILIPYLLWVSFASALNAAIFLLN